MKTAFCLEKQDVIDQTNYQVWPLAGAQTCALLPAYSGRLGGGECGGTARRVNVSAALIFEVTFRLVLFNQTKLEPIPFNCPSCKAEYKIVSIEACDVQQGKVRCLKCDTLFPAGEGRVAFKYFLVGRSKRK